MDFGVIIGAVICVIAALVCLLGGFFLAAGERRGQRGPIIFGGIFCSLLSLAGLVLVLFPFQGDYLSYHTKTGVVQATGKRLIQSGSGSTASLNQRIAVTFKDGGTYGCDDTRCSLLQPGDRLTLSCEKDWQWHGTSGWVCQFGSAYSPTGVRIA